MNGYARLVLAYDMTCGLNADDPEADSISEEHFTRCQDAAYHTLPLPARVKVDAAALWNDYETLDGSRYAGTRVAADFPHCCGEVEKLTTLWCAGKLSASDQRFLKSTNRLLGAVRSGLQNQRCAEWHDAALTIERATLARLHKTSEPGVTLAEAA